MAFPPYVKTRAVSVGGAATLESAQNLVIQVTVQSTRPLVWDETGYRFESMPVTVTSQPGAEASLSLPVTDVPGWRDGRTGALIDISTPGSVTHTYNAEVRFLTQAGTSTPIPPVRIGPFALPTGDGPIDLDKTVPVGTVSGQVISIPDTWSQIVAAAEQAAQDAADTLAQIGSPDVAATPSTVVKRTATGAVAVGAPVASTDAARKADVDRRRLVDKGQWQRTQTYAPGDAVSAFGSRWVAEASVSPTVSNVVRTNHIPNPRFQNSRAGWTATATTTAVQSGASMTVTATAAVAAGNAIALLSADIPAGPGEVWSGSVIASVPSSAPAPLSLRVSLSTYPTASANNGPTVTISPGESGRLLVEGVTVQAGKTGIRLVVQTMSALATGAVITLSDPVAEKAATVGDAFSGATPNDLGVTHAWTGAADASASTQMRQTVTGYTVPGESGSWTRLGAVTTPTRTGRLEPLTLPSPTNIAIYPGDLSPDRTRFLSIEAPALRISYDDCATWSTVYTFADPVRGVRWLADGEALVATKKADNSEPFKLWRSSGLSVNPTTATWAQVHTGGSVGSSPAHGWSWAVHENLVMVAEYGSKAGTDNARFAYLSIDYGRTWRTVYEVQNVNGQHMHGVAIDPYWDRLWITFGDVTDGIIYSDDLGTTWQYAKQGLVASAPFQSVGIIPLPHSILFASDGVPNGVYRISREQGKHSGMYDIEVAHVINDATTITSLCHSMYRARRPGDDAPLLLAYGADTVASNPALLATLDGWDFTTLWTDPIEQPVGSGLRGVFGPTARGNIVITSQDARFGSGRTMWRLPWTAAY